jgi:arylsulfatase A-like enzyme
MIERPDIVWIYCDELRTDALGCYGHPHLELHTPNLDRLASTGVRFTNNFCNSPVCVSSRCCALTGLYPEDTGVYNNEGAWKHFQVPGRPLTFPNVFAREGYATANLGKIHVARGMYPGETPGQEIFQYHDGTGGEMNIWQHLSEEAVQMIRSPNGGMNGGVYPDNVPYPPDQVTENALHWIGSAEGPSLVRISILQPHTPVLPPAEYVKLLDGQDPGLPSFAFDGLSAFERRVAAIHGLERMRPDDLRAARLHYYAQVSWVDAQVGRLLDYLENTGRTDRTVVIFSSDHGNPIGDTGAFEKHTFTPSVHRVPLVISWPGALPAGQVREDICDSLDIGKTLFALAGIEAPDQFKGRDLFSDDAPDAIYGTIGFGEPGSKMGPNGGRGEWHDGRGWPRRSCIRTRRYRLDKNTRIDARKPDPEDEDIFLADVASDPEEMTNLAGDARLSGVVRELSEALDEHVQGAVEVPPECLRR